MHVKILIIYHLLTTMTSIAFNFETAQVHYNLPHFNSLVCLFDDCHGKGLLRHGYDPQRRNMSMTTKAPNSEHTQSSGQSNAASSKMHA